MNPSVSRVSICVYPCPSVVELFLNCRFQVKKLKR